MNAKIRAGTLYDPAFEHDACGVGFVADVQGRTGAHILPLALSALGRMAHRGAVDADGKTGDGAGVTTQIPYAVFDPELERLGIHLASPGDLAVGLLFLPTCPDRRRSCKKVVAETLARQGLRFLGWRPVPIDESVLGDKARRSRPAILHLLAGRPYGVSHDQFERKLFYARREMEGRLRSFSMDEFYVASLSHRTLVYKGLLRGVDLGRFYLDLKNPAFATSFSLFHQRYSTNTFPCWALTHPFRFLAHNGEINTIQGNRNWMKARESELQSAELTGSAWLRPLIQERMSDSASLDNAAELLAMAGRDLTHSMAMLMPPAWEKDEELPDEVRAFFEYHACLMEPWDGPATVVFTDGRIVGAALDRNGLRPARYLASKDGLVVVSSEVGVVDIEEERVLSKGRLGPGDIVAVDLRSGVFLQREAIHRNLAARRPYREWLRARRVKDVPAASVPGPSGGIFPELNVAVQKALGYTREEMELILGPMYREAVEPLGSMGDDTPLAVLSAKPRLLFSYFKQRFAQVTNPPIDPIREALVMSLDTQLGPHLNLLAETPQHAAQLHLSHPVLENHELRALSAWEMEGWTSRTLSLLFRKEGGTRAFRRALDDLLLRSARAVEDGAAILILSDRGVDDCHAALPILLAVSAVHHHLLRQGLRLRTSLVAETGEARDDHQIGMLFGYGASAVNPYLALETIRAVVSESSEQEADEAAARYLKSLSKGLLKILSKMGISTLRSYQGAQLFEAIGIHEDLVQERFPGTPSQIGGIGLEEIASEVLARHDLAYAPEAKADLEEGGFHRYRKGGEAHAFAPDVVKALHALTKTGEPLKYENFADLIHKREPLVPRDLLEFVKVSPIPLDQVEPVEKIFPRFMTAAMSLGALGPEAHEVLAIAMNRIGGRSNSGEGGEDPNRYWTIRNSAIKQVASARFGVTAEYLMSAAELQIKMAQGSKPGEGGQIPGIKVAPHIARLRHALPGITLISPPPHHDIYSIEDLAQLIYDLKRVNPEARINVKLVSEVGVGTIAAGVAKAFADNILISGHDGGTGASPRGSIKNAGTPWELGLAETQQILVMSGLRRRVRLQVDGGFKTGRDVVIAALLGAEEYGFGSAVLVAAGCVMARQCHLNTCPVGVATQREDLRAKFTGTPEMVVRYLTSVADEVREILALLGCRSLEEVIGRAELLSARIPEDRFKVSKINLSRVLAGANLSGPRKCLDARNDPPAESEHPDKKVLAALHFGEDTVSPLRVDLTIANSHRAAGARIAGELARRYRGRKLPPGTLELRYRGTAGQSFGAFCVDGMQLILRGEANDYVGKGMSGGEIVISPPEALNDFSHEHIIAGNTILYGATGGRLFLAGRVGERFAVRNSGALAVVEGVGDHCCEYMTAGVVAVLGSTGRNFGAGMSGGAAYVFDPDGVFKRRYNPELVTLEANLPQKDQELLRTLLEWHYKATGSARAREILDGFEELHPLFWMVVPKEAVQIQRPRLAVPAPAIRSSPEESPAQTA